MTLHLTPWPPIPPFFCLVFLLFLFSSASTGRPLLLFSHAAIIHNLDGIHFTSDLHVTGDLLVAGNYQNLPLETLKVNVSNCVGSHRLDFIGLLSAAPFPRLHYSPGIIVNGDLYYMEYEALTRLNLDELVFEDVSADPPPVVSPAGSRTSVAMFSPRNRDGLIYIAAGNNQPVTMHFHSTWAYDVKQMQWTQKATHEFYASLPQSVCTWDRCYVQGGLSSISSPSAIFNHFYEYDYQKDEWKSLSDTDAPYYGAHGFNYLPHKDVLVAYGGVGYPSGNPSGSIVDMSQVSLFHLSNSSWVHYWDPPQVGDKIYTSYIYTPLLPCSAVYNDAIYIATADLPPPSRLVKLTIDESVPTYHHIIMENDLHIPSYSRGQIGGLVGDHILVVGGVHSVMPSSAMVNTKQVRLISLC